MTISYYVVYGLVYCPYCKIPLVGFQCPRCGYDVS